MKIVITGAGEGLGREISNQLKDNELILIDYDENKLKDVAKKIDAKYYVCDLTNSEEIKNTCGEILTTNKKIDVLINCAGVWLNEQVEKDLEQYKNMILVNSFWTYCYDSINYAKIYGTKRGLIII
jgi:gluconate 5-dehydrogenase